ncbi:MAG: rod shape-determining protein RodA [Bacteroidota bacterium]
MRQQEKILQDADWVTIAIYATLVVMGWANIFASVYDESLNQSMFDLSLNSGRQLMFIGVSVVLIIGIMAVDLRFFEAVSWVIYAVILFLVLLVPFIGKEVGGNKAWIGIGSFGGQPSEFAKFATALVAARYISSPLFKMDNLRQQATAFAIILFPMALILLQKDWGTALVFSVFILVFYREGLSPILLLTGAGAAVIFLLTLLVTEHLYLHIGVAVVFLGIILAGKKKIKRILGLTLSALLIMSLIQSADYVLNNVLKPHQQNRIKALINPDADPLGFGWNVTQSKIAIGSGGFFGKGFLKGTQTKFDFVPEQDTDFIFCTIGEEHGWVGSLFVVGLFCGLFFRLLYLAERQKNRFSRVYIYSVVCILFFHFAVNIGMTIGLFPVIGIPLPFFSYGGSSLMGFTIMLFVAVKLDAHRGQVLQRI